MGNFGNVIVRNENHKTYKLNISTVGSRGPRNEFASALPVEIGGKADNMYCTMYLFFCKTLQQLRWDSINLEYEKIFYLKVNSREWMKTWMD